MTDAVPDLYVEDLPAELLLDPAHPANDVYLRGIQRTKDLIVNLSLKMYAHHVAVVKMRHKGATHAAIAEAMGLSDGTVSRVVNSEKGRKLRALLAHLALSIDGPAEAQRRAMLTRIAQKNEDTDPRVTISAVAEVNKMAQQAVIIETASGGGTSINITINNDLMPKTVLDG